MPPGIATKWLAALRRPLPKRITVPVVVAALGVLALVLVARRSERGREILKAVVFRVVPGYGEAKIDFDAAAARLRAAGADGLPLARPRIVVRKGTRRLELFDGERPLKSYPIALGRHPEGTKARQGDGSTPEGRYFVCTRNRRSRFHLFLGLNYPNAADAARGAAAGLVAREVAAAMAEAERAGRRPAWDTMLGGEVGIHGGGTEGGDWTFGCIALADADIEELWLATGEGTPVEIRP